MTDEQERIARDFFARDLEEQQAFIQNTWCNTCQKVDLGMVEPEEYEFMERIFVEGKCAVCGEVTITEIVEDDEDDSEE
jgi:hypothetical protein